jgi:hypothetical protein
VSSQRGGEVRVLTHRPGFPMYRGLTTKPTCAQIQIFPIPRATLDHVLTIPILINILVSGRIEPRGPSKRPRHGNHAVPGLGRMPALRGQEWCVESRVVKPFSDIASRGQNHSRLVFRHCRAGQIVRAFLSPDVQVIARSRPRESGGKCRRQLRSAALWTPPFFQLYGAVHEGKHTRKKRLERSDGFLCKSFHPA